MSRILLYAALAVAIVTASGQDGRPPQLRALEAEAVCRALERFRSDAPGAKLRHYSVKVTHTRDTWDVSFVPDSAPGEEDVVGGETSYGAEVHYIFSRPKLKFIRKHFAR